MFQHYRCCGKIPNHQSLPVKVGYAEKELEKPVNTQKFEKQTSGSLKNKLQEV